MARADHALREFRDGAVGLRGRELLPADKEILENLPVEAGIVAIRKVAEIVVAQPRMQQLHDAVLHRALGGDPDARVEVLRFAACGVLRLGACAQVFWLLIHSYTSCLRFCASRPSPGLRSAACGVLRSAACGVLRSAACGGVTASATISSMPLNTTPL